MSKKFSKIIALITVFAFILFVSPGYASDEKLRTTTAPTVTATAPIPPALIVVLKKGQPAPWDGALLNPTAVAQIAVDKENAKKECDIRVTAEVSKQKAFDDTKLADKESELKYTRDTLTSQIKSRDAELESLRKRSADSSGNWVWWLSGGVVAGVVLTLGTVVIISYARN